MLYGKGANTILTNMEFFSWFINGMSFNDMYVNNKVYPDEDTVSPGINVESPAIKRMLLKGIYTRQNEYVTKENIKIKIIEDSIDLQVQSKLKVGDRIIPKANFQKILQNNFTTAKMTFDDSKSFIEYDTENDDVVPKNRKALNAQIGQTMQLDKSGTVVFKTAGWKQKLKVFFDLQQDAVKNNVCFQDTEISTPTTFKKKDDVSGIDVSSLQTNSAKLLAQKAPPILDEIPFYLDVLT